MSVRRSMPAVAAVLAMVTAVAGCSGGKGKPPATSTTVAVTARSATTATTSPAASPSTAATATAPTVAGTTRCRSSQLSAALTNIQGAAGTIYSHITFTDTSTTACTLSGYPGVSFVDGAGHQIGPPVPRMSGYGGTVTLAPNGGVAAALFRYHDAFVGTSTVCAAPVPAAGLRVYPPGETAALFVADATMACPSTAATGEAEVSAVTTPASLPG